MNEINQTSEFAATRWTLVLRAQGDSTEARAALADLCEAYYQPVLRFLRRERRDEEAARELAQEFFARILARGFGTPDPERGRFRSYVLGALKHFLADLRDREHALKRGGGAVVESLDTPAEDHLTSKLEVADASFEQPDAGFDREWALNIMARALDALKNEMSAPGKAGQFETLKSWLMGDVPGMSQAEAAKRLGLTEGAVKVAVHRLRKRFRELVRSEIAQTLRDPSLVDEELQHLIAALS